MELLAQNLESFIGIYIVIVFLLPWLVLVYWVIKFHFAVKEVMGSSYTPWEAFKKSPRYAEENKEFKVVFSKRNRCFVVVILIWLIGFAGLIGLIYTANKYKISEMNSNNTINRDHHELRPKLQAYTHGATLLNR